MAYEKKKTKMENRKFQFKNLAEQMCTKQEERSKSRSGNGSGNKNKPKKKLGLKYLITFPLS